MSPGKFCKITPKNTHFYAFWKQVLDNTVFTFFYFYGLRGWPWHSGLPPPYASGRSQPKILGADQKFGVGKMFDFRRATAFWGTASQNKK